MEWLIDEGCSVFHKLYFIEIWSKNILDSDVRQANIGGAFRLNSVFGKTPRTILEIVTVAGLKSKVFRDTSFCKCNDFLI